MAQAPCFAQWESPGLGRDFAADPARLADDPLWAASGARDVAEYARWAHHVCGMACVRMVLAARSIVRAIAWASMPTTTSASTPHASRSHATQGA